MRGVLRVYYYGGTRHTIRVAIYHLFMSGCAVGFYGYIDSKYVMQVIIYVAFMLLLISCCFI